MQAEVQSSQELREKLQVTSVSFGPNRKFLLHMSIKSISSRALYISQIVAGNFTTDCRDQC